MKKILTLCLLILSIYTKAQTDTSSLQNSALSDSTSIGIADGELTKKSIGIEGGTIVSDDGRVELIFPAGALSKNTVITIQPSVNMAPNGTGKAYSFEPSGIQFKKPVQIIFHYTDEEDETCPADLMSFAMQDHKGKWSFFNYEAWDSVGKTLKGFIQHFSTASNIDQLKLRPDKNELLVKKTTSIGLIDISRIVKDGPYQGNYDLATLLKRDATIWYVNGKTTNPLSGTISAFNGILGKEKMVIADYTAPEFLPVNNPVTIKLKISYRSPKTKKTVVKNLTCTIAVYDAYKIKVTATIETRVSMQNEFLDSATFVFFIYHSYYRMDDPLNYPPILVKEGKLIASCKLKTYLEGALGLIHLTKAIKNYRLERLIKDGPPEITFDFPVPEILLCQYRVTCRGIAGTIEPLMIESVVTEINFLANGKFQRIHFNDTKVGGYVLEVTPYR